MKRLNKILLAALLLALPISFTGCGTTAPAKAAQVERVIILSVNDAMTEWAAHVNAGLATQKQIDTVKTAYNSYFVAQRAAKAAIEKAIIAGDTAATETDIASANQAVSDAEAALLSLINSFIK